MTRRRARVEGVYGRTLAYVYLPDGTFLNAEIIRQGHAYTQFPFRYLNEFRALEREARAGRGLWADEEIAAEGAEKASRNEDADAPDIPADNPHGTLQRFTDGLRRVLSSHKHRVTSRASPKASSGRKR